MLIKVEAIIPKNRLIRSNFDISQRLQWHPELLKELHEDCILEVLTKETLLRRSVSKFLMKDVEIEEIADFPA